MTKIVSLTAVVAAIAISGFAALSPELADWAKGPTQHLLTREEAAAWKTVRTDDEAKAFIALFWARRDPTPATPRNEFREEYERRVIAADRNFVGEKTRGALTERGMAFVLFGKPTKVERAGAQRTGALPGISGGISPDRETPNTPPGGPGLETGTPPKMDDFTAGGSTRDTEGQVWTYDNETEVFGQGRAQLRFVDRHGKGTFSLQRDTVDVAAARRRAIERSIKQPGLTVAPTFSPDAAAAEVVSIPDVPVAPQTELTSESLKTAIAEFRAAAKSPYEKVVYPSWGEFVTSSGTTFVPVMLYVPKSTGLTATQDLTFFGVFQDAGGANVLAFEEPVKLVASKNDFFVDRTVMLPAGKHRAFLGLAENGKAISIAAADLNLTGSLDKDATAVSPLILSNNLYPLMEAQDATDPFAFGGVKVVPKADRRFTSADELWYFFEMRNPGLPEAPAAAATADAAAPAAPAEAAEVLPKIQVKIDVEGTTAAGQKVKRTAPPNEISAIPMKGVPGHYGVGSAIPLATFKPGDYTFTVKVIDTVKKASYTLTEKFTLVE